MPWPEAEVAVDEDLVRRLLSSQHPDLADERVELVDAGFDNFIFRLGPHDAIRLPRRAPAATLIEHEQRWMPRLPTDLAMQVPTPKRLGRPGHGYPWHWSIVAWIEGEPADRTPPADTTESAVQLGRFIEAMHRAAPPDLPLNPFRSGPLETRQDAFRDRLSRLGGHVSKAEAQQIWAGALEAPPHEGPKVWLHGDLHPANLLVRDGVVTAVIDFGDTCAGDPACDLGALYLTIPPRDRDRLAPAATEATKRRATGWALLFALMLLDIGLTQRPTYADVARRALKDLSPGSAG